MEESKAPVVKSMIGGMFKNEIKEVDAGLHEADKELYVIEAKLDPFITKITPVFPAIFAELAALSPTLAKAVTPQEIAEVGAALAALPEAMKALHGIIAQAETKVEHL